MAAWADITVDTDRLIGLEAADFISSLTDTIDESLITDELIEASKETFKEKALATLFNMLGDFGGETELFNEIANTPSLSDRIDAAMAYAYLHHFYRGQLLSIESVNLDKSEYYWMRFEEAMKTFVSMATTEIDTGNDLTTGKSKTVQQRNTVDWYNV